MPNEYGIDEDGLVNGLLAGARFRGLQEELKLSRLQRLEFEANKQHRDTMSLLQEQLGQAQLGREKLYSEIGELEKKREELALQFAVEDRPGEKAGKAAATSLVRGQAKAQRLANKAQKAEQPFRQRAVEAGARTAESTALGTALGVSQSAAKSIGKGSVMPGLEDVTAFLTANGVDQKALPMLAQVMYGEIQGQEQELADNKAVLDRAARAADAEAFRDKAASTMNAVQAGLNLADLEGRAPGALNAYAASIKPDDVFGQTVLSIARAGVAKNLSPGDKAKASVLQKQLEIEMGSRSSKEEELATVGDHTYIIGSEAAARSKAELELKRIDDRIAKLTEQLDSLGKKAAVTTKETGAPLDIETKDVPVIKTQAAYDKLPSGANYRETEGGPIFRKP